LVQLGSPRLAFLARFFTGFCLIANGAYLAFGSLNGIGDCGELLRQGASQWQLWLFGALTMPMGLLLWHNQGSHFGFGPSKPHVDIRLAYGCLAVVCFSVALEFLWGNAQVP
jgi:hypothetical protein